MVTGRPVSTTFKCQSYIQLEIFYGFPATLEDNDNLVCGMGCGIQADWTSDNWPDLCDSSRPASGNTMKTTSYLAEVTMKIRMVAIMMKVEQVVVVASVTTVPTMVLGWMVHQMMVGQVEQDAALVLVLVQLFRQGKLLPIGFGGFMHSLHISLHPFWHSRSESCRNLDAEIRPRG